MAQLPVVFFPVPELWVPRPCAFCKGGYDAADTMRCYACGLASYVRRAPSALYHLLMLPPIGFSAYRAQPRSRALDSGAGTPALSLCGRRIRRYARTHSPTYHGARGWHSVYRNAGAQTAHGANTVAKEKAAGCATRPTLRRHCSAHAFLAGSFLRLQCVDREEAGRETSVHPSQSGETRTSQDTRAMALEQLSLLSPE
jgi:hypothetical protein